LITIERYRKTRFWAVYDAGELVCVTVYKKGAHAVKERLDPDARTIAPVEERRSAAIPN
jgi:hypothetical protein